LIATQDPASLFYAALELRMGVEARLQAYAHANSEVVASLKRGWQIQKLAQGLDKVFKRARDVVQLTYQIPGQTEPFMVLRYTPVTSRLTKIAEKLGDYLHYRAHRVTRDDAWWEDFRLLVVEGHELLAMATSGELLGPPLWYPKTGPIQVVGERQNAVNQLSRH